MVLEICSKLSSCLLCFLFTGIRVKSFYGRPKPSSGRFAKQIAAPCGGTDENLSDNEDDGLNEDEDYTLFTSSSESECVTEGDESSDAESLDLESDNLSQYATTESAHSDADDESDITATAIFQLGKGKKAFKPTWKDGHLPPNHR